MRRAILVLVLATSACGRCGGGDSPPPAVEGPTVEGPESADLAAALSGHLVLIRTSKIQDVALPAKTETTLRAAAADHGAFTLAGPDSAGRVAFIAADGKDMHALETIEIGGKNERSLFSRKGDPLWGHVIGVHIALASRGGNIAIVSNPKGEQVGGALLEVGDIEVWNIETGQGAPLGIKAEQTGLSFFADGSRLAYVALDAPEEAQKLPGAADMIGPQWGKWSKVPVIHVVELATKKDEPIAIGWLPVVSPDGTFLLAKDGNSSLRRIDPTTKASRTVDVPGGLGGGAVALPSANIVLYHALTTKGAPMKDRGMSMGGREVLHTIKVAKLDTREFATLTDEISMHTRVSFGP